MVRVTLPKPQLCDHALVPGQGNARYYRTCGEVQPQGDDTVGRHHTPATHRWCGEPNERGYLKTNQRWHETMGSPKRGDPHGDRAVVVLKCLG